MCKPNKNNEKRLSHKDLLRQIEYFPLNGDFIWRIAANNRVKIGGRAGCVDKTLGYRRICINSTEYKAHRLAFFYMTGRWPKNTIDHIDGNRANNIFTNLRAVTQHENNKNKRKSKNNTSGITGVRWLSKERRWTAYIYASGKMDRLLYTRDLFEACCARKSAELKYCFHANHGDIKHAY